MKIAYEYRKHTENTKCILVDNLNDKEYIVDLPYPFEHSFWHLPHDCPTVLDKSKELIKQSLGE